MRILLPNRKPVEISEPAPSGIGNFINLPISVLMLVLSLRDGNNSTP